MCFYILTHVIVSHPFFLCAFFIILMRRRDCGFFMLQILLTYDGKSMVVFSQNDILNIRMTLLYGWLTRGDFNIDLRGLLGVDAGMLCVYAWIIFSSH